MNKQNISDQTLQKLIQLASCKMGVSPETLQSKLQSGDFSGLSHVDNNTVQQLSQQPQTLQSLLNSPQAQELLKKLRG